MKRTIAFILAAIMLLALASCGADTDEAFAVKNDTERMTEQAADNSAGTKVSKLKVPDGNYTYQASAADGKLTINVDAPVTVPDSEKIPTARVSETGFTQEQVTAFFNYLFPDEKPVTGANVPGVLTKDEIQELILMYKKYIAEGTVEQNTLYTEDEMDEEIKSLEKQYESAPETEPELDTHVSDGTMTAETLGGDKYAGEKIMVLDAKTEDKWIYACVPVDENGGWENNFGFHVDNGPYSFSDKNAVSIDETNWPSAAEGKLTISYEDAKTLCDSFFEAGGITDVTLSDAYVVDDEETAEGRAHSPENYAYKFNYVRTVGDSPVANMSYNISGGDDNSLPWMYERIIFWVGNNGLESIDWSSHTTTGEIINEDTGVIGFEEAREIFETMIVSTYGATEAWTPGLSKVSIDINDIALSPVRVREQNAPGRNGIYTPAWVFYGNIKREFKYDGNEFVQYGWDIGIQNPFAKYPVLIINAVDGSIIDAAKSTQAPPPQPTINQHLS